MILFDQVSKRYEGANEALSQVNFHLNPGEMAFLTGHSGAGKSTLLKLVALIERASTGNVIVGGKNLNKINRHTLPYMRRNMGIIFQDYQLLYDRTVYDNVALPLIISGFSAREVKNRVHAALDKVGLLRFEKKYPLTLSGGEQQRVSIARAVVNKPALLLADEPTGNLDPDLSYEIMKLFLAFNQVGVTVLIATHDIPLINKLDKRIIHLEQGRISHTARAQTA
ncbi:MAG: cell division ATP-binding protein FtsE [gamma proteobacterium symbiont of Taylorina sp.]|nr:cell division ATP-binding protein FtsE [gamma proteobacterium symbiont of Taylorina sp.]